MLLLQGSYYVVDTNSDIISYYHLMTNYVREM